MKNYLGISYDRRYFQLDIEKLTFKYAKDEASINDKNVYEEQFRNLKSVKKNVVSMPVTENGQTKLKEMDIFEGGVHIDRGPGDTFYSVFELHTTSRLFTLYTDDADLLCKFVLHLERVI